MHAMVRAYSGQGATELYDLLIERKDEVREKMNAVSGLVSYDLAQTDDGCVALIICRDKLGCDQSMSIAKEWLAENAKHLGLTPPKIIEGEIGIHLP
jgi:hypothetical protein